MPPAPRSAARNAQALTDAPENAKVRVSQVLTHSSGALTELLSADKWLRLCQAARQSFPRPDQPERRTRHREDAPAARAAVSIQGRAPQAETIGTRENTAPLDALLNRRRAQIPAASIRPSARRRRSTPGLRIPSPPIRPAPEQSRPSVHSAPSQSHTRSQPP